MNGETRLSGTQLRPNGKNGVRGTKDMENMIICKLLINKHKNICVSIY
jgi:hypothetical protein